ncbi:MAG: ORF6N domain-containing protein [Agathobacter sp.]|nr:ORF6N domain-containing protein [Agathobacter sp.]
MEKEKKEITLINEEMIQEKIYLVRGQKVMLDVDLAEIYGYETKNFNRQVKNNIEKFEGEDFMFQLTAEEWENLRCKNCTSSWGGSRYLPLAFTEQGIYMLMTVLRGELATQQSRALVRTFKKMKDYILENQNLIGDREYLQLSLQVSESFIEMKKLRSDLYDVEEQITALILNSGGEGSRWENLISNKTIYDVDEELLKQYTNKAHEAGRIAITYSDKATVLNQLELTCGINFLMQERPYLAMI